MRIALTVVLILTAGCAASRDRVATSPAKVWSAGDPWGPPGSSTRGEIIARTRCGSCHAVGRLETSPMAGAPPFRGLGQRYPVAQLQEALGEGLVTAHPAMPEIRLEADEVADIIAYLDSVGTADAHAP